MVQHSERYEVYPGSDCRSIPRSIVHQQSRLGCSEFSCNGAWDFRNIFYIQPMDSDFSDRTVEAYWDTNTVPTTCRLSAEIMQWAQTGDKDLVAFELPIQFGKNVLIQVPNDWELVHITGKTVTGEPIDVVYPSGSDLLKPLPCNLDRTQSSTIFNRPTYLHYYRQRHQKAVLRKKFVVAVRSIGQVQVKVLRSTPARPQHHGGA